MIKIRRFFWRLYWLLGSPVIGTYTMPRWYNYIRPKRLTLKHNPAIYCWCGFNVSWNKEAFENINTRIR